MLLLTLNLPLTLLHLLHLLLPDGVPLLALRLLPLLHLLALRVLPLLLNLLALNLLFLLPLLLPATTHLALLLFTIPLAAPGIASSATVTASGIFPATILLSRRTALMAAPVTPAVTATSAVAFTLGERRPDEKKRNRQNRKNSYKEKVDFHIYLLG
ncbi:MAG TPA: hypothetical protein VMZ26_04640 [Pyrinomonadaceae bacterium]|nr:hypothetical protein [Pyrinomonadaceae bacterium]